MPHNVKGQPVQFYLCSLRRPDQPKHEQPHFHFHEMYANQKRPAEDHTCQTCQNEGKVYNVVELAHEGARAKANDEFDRYKAVRPALIEHRVQVEVELRKASRGAWPPPHIVMDKLL